jgi:hypothetical protein
MPQCRFRPLGRLNYSPGFTKKTHSRAPMGPRPTTTARQASQTQRALATLAPLGPVSSAWGKGREHAGGPAVASVSLRVLRTRRAAGAGTPWAEALSVRAVSPCRRVSSHCTRHCGATATWRRLGVGSKVPQSAPEARVDVLDEEEGAKCLEGTLGEGRRSWDADTRKAATGP